MVVFVCCFFWLGSLSFEARVLSCILLLFLCGIVFDSHACLFIEFVFMMSVVVCCLDCFCFMGLLFGLVATQV